MVYNITLTVKEKKNNYWVPVDKLVNLEPKEAVLIIESKYNNRGTKVSGKRLFEILGIAFDETAHNLDLLLGVQNKK